MLIIYKFSAKFFKKLILFAEAVFTGFWLGILTKNQLDRIDELYYEKEVLYANDSYNLSGLFEWEKNVLNKFFKPNTKILLLSSGGGREVFGLREMSFDVDAYECNFKLLKYANTLLEQKSVPALVKFVERDQCPDFEGNFYEGAIIGWSGYMLVQGKEQRIKLLKQIHQQITPGSPVLISFYPRTGNDRLLKITSKIANIFRFWLFRKPCDAGDYLLPNYVHFFNKAEIQEEFSNSCFDLVFFAKQPYGYAVGKRNENIGLN
jgi:hypothetical protein